MRVPGIGVNRAVFCCAMYYALVHVYNVLKPRQGTTLIILILVRPSSLACVMCFCNKVTGCAPIPMSLLLCIAIVVVMILTFQCCISCFAVLDKRRVGYARQEQQHKQPSEVRPRGVCRIGCMSC